MWRPDGVIPQHKGRARIIWGGLLFTMLAYTIWQIVTIGLERADPSSSVTISNDLYGFPFVLVCMWEEAGCAYSDVSSCITSAIDDFDSYVEYGEQQVFATQSDQFYNCVSFDLTTIDVNAGDEEDITTTASMYLYWVAAEDGDDLATYSESVGVYLGADEELYEFVSVPYARNLFSSTEFNFVITSLTFGKTIRKFLVGDSITTFPALTSSTTNYVQDFDGSVSDATLGALVLHLTQGRYSLSEIKDIDPVEIGTFLGNLGGFWELLIIAWGLCFIAALGQSDPSLRARNFSESFEQGKKVVTRRLSINSSKAPSPDAGQTHENAYWEAGYRGPAASANRDASGGHAQSAAFQPGVGISASSRRPVVFGVPRRAGTRDSSIDGSTSSSRVAEATGALPSYGDHVIEKPNPTPRVSGASDAVLPSYNEHKSSEDAPPSYGGHRNA